MAGVGELDTVGGELVGEVISPVEPGGRILLTKSHRRALGKNFAMNIGEMGHICIYPEHSWRRRNIELDSFSPDDPVIRDYSLLFFEHAVTGLSCDAQGRITIPKRLREAGKIGDEVVVLGLREHLMLWSQEDKTARTAKILEPYGGDREKAIEALREKMRAALRGNGPTASQ